MGVDAAHAGAAQLLGPAIECMAALRGTDPLDRFLHQNGPQQACDRQNRVSLGHPAECNFPRSPDKRMFDLLDSG